MAIKIQGSIVIDDNKNVLSNTMQVGVSAQEVEAVLPEVVTEAPINPEYKTVYYDKLVPLLIEAIKEQQEQIEELREKVG